MSATSKTLSLLDLMEAQQADTPAADTPAPAATEKPKKRARKVAPDLTPAFEGSHTITHGDVLAVLRELPSNEFDACLCDPPYGFSFMGKKWDYDVPSVDVWRELLRVLKPGAPLISFGGTRTYHRVTCAIEDAGFEIRDSIAAWIYGSGFPKSLDVSKAIDAKAGAKRAVIGKHVYAGGHVQNSTESIGFGGSDPAADRRAVTAPSTPLARQWAGTGTALKPAWEPAILARKPLGIPAIDVVRNVELSLRAGGLTGDIEWQRESANGAGSRKRTARSSRTAKPQAAETSAACAASFETENTAQQTQRYTESGGLTGTQPAIKIASVDTLGRTTEGFATRSSLPTEAAAHAAGSESGTSSRLTMSGAEELPTDEPRTARSTRSSGERTSPPTTESFAGIATGLSGSMAHVRIERLANGSLVWPEGLPRVVAEQELTVAANVAKWGTGALAIDACRIGSEGGGTQCTNRDEFGACRGHSNGGRSTSGETFHGANAEGALGRWPANVILDEEAGAALDAQAGNIKSGIAVTRNGGGGHIYTGLSGKESEGFAKAPRPDSGYSDSGGASRFFYSAKVSTKEREWGCDTVERIEMRFTMPGSEVRTVQLLVDTASSPPRAISASGMCSSSESEWSTFLFGSQSTAPFRPACRFTTRTGTSSTTESKTWKHSPLLSTSGSTLAASSETEIGGSPVPSAASSSTSTESIGTSPKDTPPSHGASHATLRELFERSESVEIAISEALPKSGAAEMTSSEEGQARLDSPRTGAGRGGGARCHHPTLKPIALTRWLARLIMPPTPNAQLIVPFSGAGSEMIGALQAGWPSVFGIEGEAEYVDIANARIAAWKKGTP